MGMSTYVEGFVPPDERYQQMVQAWEACQAAGVSLPEEVSEFFGWKAPDPNGRVVEIPVHDWRDDHRRGIEVHVAELPPNVTVVRFVNSW